MFRFLIVALAMTTTAAFSPLSQSMSIVSPRASTIVLKEAAARKAWIASVDAANAAAMEKLSGLRQTATIPAPAATVVTTTEAPQMSDNAAKLAWLSKIDQPRSKLGVVSEATAKARWIAKVDEAYAKWGAGNVVPTQEALEELVEEIVTTSTGSDPDEAAAKAAWIAKVDEAYAKWGAGKVVPTRDAPAEPVLVATKSSDLTEAAAKAAWLAKIDKWP